MLTEEQIAEAVQRLARQIEDVYLPGGFGIVPILPQCNTFVHHLLREIRIPFRLFHASVFAESLGDEDGKSYFRLTGKVESHEELPDKVLVVSAYSGSSIDYLGYLCDSLRALPNVKNVKSCVLLEFGDCDSVELPFDFVGHRVTARTQDLAGYGLGAFGYYTQLPNISTVELPP